MSTPERVEALFHMRIENDSSEQLEKAGAGWFDLPLDFFYLQHAADTVDIVVTSIAKQVAQEDGVQISDEVLENLQSLVDPETIVR